MFLRVFLSSVYTAGISILNFAQERIYRGAKGGFCPLL